MILSVQIHKLTLIDDSVVSVSSVLLDIQPLNNSSNDALNEDRFAPK